MNLQENPQEKEFEGDAVFDEDEFQVVENSNSRAMITTEHQSQEFTFEDLQQYLMMNLQDNPQVGRQTNSPVIPEPVIPPNQIYGSPSQSQQSISTEGMYKAIVNHANTVFQLREDYVNNLCLQYVNAQQIQHHIRHELIQVYGFQPHEYPFAELTCSNPYNASSLCAVPQSQSEPSQQSFDQLDPSYQS